MARPVKFSIRPTVKAGPKMKAASADFNFGANVKRSSKGGNRGKPGGS